MAGVNKVILVGNLGKDPEVRHLENGATVANFSLATTESYKDRQTGERRDQTEWHNVVLWRGLAEVAEKYLKKGSQVYIEGKIRTRSWQDQEGNTRYTTEVVGNEMTMLGRAGEGRQQAPSPSATDASQAASAPAAATQSATTTPDIEDDLPF